MGATVSKLLKKNRDPDLGFGILGFGQEIWDPPLSETSGIPEVGFLNTFRFFKIQCPNLGFCFFKFTVAPSVSVNGTGQAYEMMSYF